MSDRTPNLPEIIERHDVYTSAERISRLEVLLSEHLRQEEAFQDRLVTTMDELAASVKSLTKTHETVKGIAKGLTYAGVIFAAFFTETGHKVIEFFLKIGAVNVKP